VATTIGPTITTATATAIGPTATSSRDRFLTVL
jgi:hypothetical protein